MGVCGKERPSARGMSLLLDCGTRFASYYKKALGKEEVARRRSSWRGAVGKRVWSDLGEPVGRAGKAAGSGGRKGCLSVARGGGRRRRLRCVGGVAVVVAGRGRESGRWRRGGWVSAVVVEEGHNSRAVLTSAGRRAAATRNGAPSSEAFRLLVVRACVRECAGVV